jgi:hypothetical protein
MSQDSTPDPHAHEDPQGREQHRLLADLDRSWEEVQRLLLRDLAAGRDGEGIADSIRHALLRAAIMGRMAPSAPAPHSPSSAAASSAPDAPTSPAAGELAEQAELRRRLGLVSLLDRQQKAQQLFDNVHASGSYPVAHDPAPSLTEGLPAAWDAVLVEDESNRNCALAGIVQRVPADDLPRILQWVQAAGDDWFLVRALYELAKRADAVPFQRLLLHAALAIPTPDIQGVALEIVAPILEGDAVAPAVAAVLAIPHVRLGAGLLYLLAPQIGGELLSVTVASVLALGAEPQRLALLSVLAPRLHGPLLNQVLQSLRGAQEQAARLGLLVTLVEQFDLTANPDLLPAVARTAIAAPTSSERLLLIAATAAQAPATLRVGLCEQVVAGLWQGLAVEVKTQALRTVGPYLNTEQLRKALGMLGDLTSHLEQAALLRVLIPFLPAPLAGSVLGLARRLQDPGSRCRVLAALLPHLEGQRRADVAQEAISGLAELWDLEGQAEVLCALAPYLEEDTLRVAVARARLLPDKQARARTLQALSPYCAATLRRDLIDEALAVASAIRSARRRCETLLALAGALEGEAAGEGFQRAVSGVLAALSLLNARAARAAVLANLLSFVAAPQRRRILIQVLVMLDIIGASAAGTADQPGVTGTLDGGLDPEEFTGVLRVCAPYLDDTWLLAVLAVVRRLDDPLHRARGFAALLACRSHSSRRLIWLHFVQDLYTLGRFLSETMLCTALATPGLLAPPQVTASAAAALVSAILALDGEAA